MLPIPPLIDSGAGVVAFPMNTAELKSDDRVVFPLPAAVNVKFPLPVVAKAADAVFPKLSVVAEIPRVAAEVMVARLLAVNVVVLSASVAAVFKFASELAVNVVVFGSVSVAAVLKLPKDVAFKFVAPFKVTVGALIVNKPLLPLFGLITMFPVVPPPMVRVLLLSDWIVPGLSDKPEGAVR